MLHARTIKHNHTASFPQSATRTPARHTARRKGSVGRAALAAAVESLETRRLMSATHAVFTTEPTDINAGFNEPVTVSLESAGGAVDTSNTSNVTLTIATGPTGATVDGTATEAAVDGVATFSNLTFTKAGTYTLTATSTGLTSGTSTSFNVSSSGQYRMVFGQIPTGSVMAGASLGTVTVDLVDQYGNLDDEGGPEYVQLTGTSLAGGSNFVNGVNGVVTFTGLSMTQAGPQTLEAEEMAGVDGFLNVSVTSPSFTIAPAAASQVVFTTEPSNGYVGVALDPVEASLEDEYGNVETGDNTSDVTMAIGTNPGSATLAGTTTQAVVAGVATFSNLKISTAGTGYTLHATSGSLTPATSSTFDADAIAIWTDGSGDGQWNTPANWQGDVVPSSGENVEFPNLGSTDGTVTLANGVTVGDIRFDGGGYNLAGSQQITLEGNVTSNADGNQISDELLLTGDFTITVAASDDLVLSGGADDGGNGYDFTKDGAGTLTVSDGTLNLQAGSELAQGVVEVNNGGSINGALSVDSGTTLYAADGVGNIVGNGGTVYIGDQGSPASIFAGSISLDSGTNWVETYSSGGSGEVTAEVGIDLSGATLTVDRLDNAVPTPGTVLTLISNQTGNPVEGTFNNLPEGALFTSNGVTYQITYQAGINGDVTLTVIAPAVWTGDGGDGQWNTAANWQGDAVPLAGQSVDFPNYSSNNTSGIYLGSDVEVGDFTIEGNYIFNNDTITVDGSITADGSDDELQNGLVLNHTTTVNVGSGDQLLTTAITDAGSNDGITLTGGGTLLVGGSGSSTGGPIDVQSGTLLNEGGVSSAVTVDPGGTVEGPASFNSGIVGNGGTISLGASDYSSNIYDTSVSSVTFSNGTTLHEELSDGEGGEVDGELTVTGGTINLTGSNLTLGTQNGFAPALGDVITVISNQTGSAVTGTFNGLAEGAIATFNGVAYQVSYLGGESGHDVTLTVVNPVTNPTVVSVMPTDVTPSARATLSILGEDPNTENDSDLTYTWSVAHAPSGAKPVKFSENGTNAAKDATARFQKAGTYHLLCTISNGDGGTTTQMVSVTIKQVKTSLRLEPHAQSIAAGATEQYSGVVLDQFKHAIPTTSITYAVNTGGGTIDDSGLFTAGEDPGHVVIQMTVDGLTGVVGATIV